MRVLHWSRRTLRRGLKTKFPVVPHRCILNRGRVQCRVQCPFYPTALEFLDSPVGSAEYKDATLSAKFAKAVACCEQVGHLKDPQLNLGLLQRCAGVCRVLHLLKVVPPDRTGLNLSQQARRQAGTAPYSPLKGFGLRQSYRLAAPSFVTSVRRFRAVAPLLGAGVFTAQSLFALADGLQHFCRQPHQVWAW